MVSLIIYNYTYCLYILKHEVQILCKRSKSYQIEYFYIFTEIIANIFLKFKHIKNSINDKQCLTKTFTLNYSSCFLHEDFTPCL